MTTLTVFSPSGDATVHECRRLPEDCPVCRRYLPVPVRQAGAA